MMRKQSWKNKYFKFVVLVAVAAFFYFCFDDPGNDGGLSTYFLILNIVIVAAIAPKIDWTWSKHQRLDSVQLRGASTFNINNTECFIYRVLRLCSFHRGFLLHNISSQIHFFDFNYQNPRPYYLYNSFQNVHYLSSFLFIFMLFQTISFFYSYTYYSYTNATAISSYTNEIQSSLL